MTDKIKVRVYLISYCYPGGWGAFLNYRDYDNGTERPSRQDIASMEEKISNKNGVKIMITGLSRLEDEWVSEEYLNN